MEIKYKKASWNTISYTNEGARLELKNVNKLFIYSSMVKGTGIKIGPYDQLITKCSGSVWSLPLQFEAHTDTPTHTKHPCGGVS